MENKVRTAILIMGATGVGKSTFIARTIGTPAPFNHESDGDTPECWAWEYIDETTGKLTVLIDTPGFDAVDQPSLSVLDAIVKYLTRTPSLHVVMALYLHPITETRVTGTARINLRTFQALCGEHFYQNIIVATNMWQATPKRMTETLQLREAQLNESDAFWADMLRKGSNYQRYLGDAKSGRDIVAARYEIKKAPPLNILLEMRKEGMKLEHTKAGSILAEEMRKREEKKRQELRREREELEAEIAEKSVQELSLEATKDMARQRSSQTSTESSEQKAQGGVKGIGRRKLGTFLGL